MSGHLDALTIRRRLGRDVWGAPQPFGPDGWKFVTTGGGGGSVIVSCADHGDGVEIVHASMSMHSGIPDYNTLTRLHRAVWGDDGYAYQQFVPARFHVNIAPHALHLFGRLDGQPIAGLPVLTGGTL